MVAVNSTMLPLGTAAPDFQLPDTDGKSVRLSDFNGQPLLVIFLCNHCPFVQHLAGELAAFAREYQKKGLSIVGISSNDIAAFPQDGPAKMKEEKAGRGYVFAYLFDDSQEVAKAYRAACTPDFYLFDAAHRLVYRGRFDETRPQQTPPQKPHGRDLRAVADALLAGRRPPAEQVPSIGCNIKWKPGSAPDYFPT
jgi:peroxiredoxin